MPWLATRARWRTLRAGGAPPGYLASFPDVKASIVGWVLLCDWYQVCLGESLSFRVGLWVDARYRVRAEGSGRNASGLFLSTVFGLRRVGFVAGLLRAVGCLCVSRLGEVAPGPHPLGARSRGVACGPRP